MKKIKSCFYLLSSPFLVQTIVSCSSNHNNDIDLTISKIKEDLNKENIEVEKNDQITKDFLNKLINKVNEKYNQYSIDLESFSIDSNSFQIALNLKITDKSDSFNFKEFNALVKYKIKDQSSKELSFKDQYEFNWGESNIYTNDAKINNQYLKKLIIDNKDKIFNNSDQYSNDFFKTQLNIEQVWKNNGEGFITIKIKIDFKQSNKFISENICIQGYKKYDENLIQLPPVKDETKPTQAEFDAEVNYWKNEIPLGLRQYYFTQEELKKLNGDEIRDLLVDLRTFSFPINFTVKFENRPFNLDVEDIIIDNSAKLIKCKLVISDWYKLYTPQKIEKEFKFDLYVPNPDELIDKILPKTDIIVKNDAYKKIKAKIFLEYNIDQINKYFELNNQSIYQLFWMEPGFNNIVMNLLVDKNSYNFKKPTSLNFNIEISYARTNIKKIKTKQINGFKKVETIGLLDSKPIENLTTPKGAISYKGELEKFYFDEFIETTRINYVDKLKQVTYEEAKKEMVYQVRFYLYQMFGDNFTEINYYIKDEKNPDTDKATFIVVGEGIIDKPKTNLFYGFQTNINTPGHNATSNLKSNDRVKIELNFDAGTKGSGFRPSIIERGTIGTGTYSWYWNYQNNCNNLSDSKAPLIKDDIPRNDWAVKYYSVSINNVYKINSKINQYNCPWFSKQYIILKKS